MARPDIEPQALELQARMTAAAGEVVGRSISRRALLSGAAFRERVQVPSLEEIGQLLNDENGQASTGAITRRLVVAGLGANVALMLLEGAKRARTQEFIADTRIISVTQTWRCEDPETGDVFRRRATAQLEAFANAPFIQDSVVTKGISTNRNSFPEQEAALNATVINGKGARGFKQDLTITKWNSQRAYREKVTGWTGDLDVFSFTTTFPAPEFIEFEGQLFKTLAGVGRLGRTTDGFPARQIKVDAPDKFLFPMVATRDITVVERDGCRAGDGYVFPQGILKSEGEFLFFVEVDLKDAIIPLMDRSWCGNLGGRRIGKEGKKFIPATPPPTPKAAPEVPEIKPAPTLAPQAPEASPTPPQATLPAQGPEASPTPPEATLAPQQPENSPTPINHPPLAPDSNQDSTPTPGG